MQVIVLEEGSVKLKNIQILGKPGTGGGLVVFPQPATAVSPSAQQQASYLRMLFNKEQSSVIDWIGAVSDQLWAYAMKETVWLAHSVLSLLLRATMV